MSTALALVEGEVVEPEPTLAELSAAANREHRAGQRAAATAIDHAIAAGDALRQAQARVGSGEWAAWMSQHFDGSSTTANCYMRLAAYREHLPKARMTIREAHASLGDLPAVGLMEWSKTPDARKKEARRLRGEGMKIAEIAFLMDASTSAVSRWVDPDETRKRRARSAKARADRRLARERRRDGATHRAVRKSGAATAEAWAMAERLQDVLAQAHRETQDREARAALSRAGEHYRKMRDEIVAAVGVT